MQFLFIILRIKGLYIFRELLAHPQEALYKRLLGYCMRVMLVSCIRIINKLNKNASRWFHYTDIL
jgi:hypothetical protein